MNTFTKCRFGWVSLTVGILEVAIIWGSLGLVRATGLWGHAPLWLEDVFAISYLAGWVAVAIAIAGLVKDTHRVVAALALLLGIVNAVLCALPLVTA